MSSEKGLFCDVPNVGGTEDEDGFFLIGFSGSRAASVSAYRLGPNRGSVPHQGKNTVLFGSRFTCRELNGQVIDARRQPVRLNSDVPITVTPVKGKLWVLDFSEANYGMVQWHDVSAGVSKVLWEPLYVGADIPAGFVGFLSPIVEYALHYRPVTVTDQPHRHASLGEHADPAKRMEHLDFYVPVHGATQTMHGGICGFMGHLHMSLRIPGNLPHLLLNNEPGWVGEPRPHRYDNRYLGDKQRLETRMEADAMIAAARESRRSGSF